MLMHATDVVRGAVVWLFTGPTNTDDDFERYVATLGKLAKLAEGRLAPAGIQIVDPGNPPPNAHWRKRIAEASFEFNPAAMFALVSPSPMVRGVVTAINWVRRPSFRTATFSHFDDATGWIGDLEGPPAHVFEALLAEVRAEVGPGAPVAGD